MGEQMLFGVTVSTSEKGTTDRASCRKILLSNYSIGSSTTSTVDVLDIRN